MKSITKRKRLTTKDRQWLAFYDGRDNLLTHLINLLEGIRDANREQRVHVMKLNQKKKTK